jgi:uncharacterized phage-associated protein
MSEEIRNNVPKEDIVKFKEVLIYLLSKVGAKSNVGKTVIVKLLYFIDFDYYEEKETQLMGMKYIKKQHGPFPLLYDSTVKEMEQNGDIIPVKEKYFGRDQQKYLPLREANLSCLSGDELEYIRKVLRRYSDMTATQLTHYSHMDVPWIAAKDGEVLEYEGVFYRTPETSVRNYCEIPD